MAPLGQITEKKEQDKVGPFTVSLLETNVWHIEDCTSSHPHGFSVKEDGSYSFYSSSDMYIVRGKKKAILILVQQCQMGRRGR